MDRLSTKWIACGFAFGLLVTGCQHSRSKVPPSLNYGNPSGPLNNPMTPGMNGGAGLGGGGTTGMNFGNPTAVEGGMVQYGANNGGAGAGMSSPLGGIGSGTGTGTTTGAASLPPSYSLPSGTTVTNLPSTGTSTTAKP